MHNHPIGAANARAGRVGAFVEPFWLDPRLLCGIALGCFAAGSAGVLSPFAPGQLGGGLTALVVLGLAALLSARRREAEPAPSPRADADVVRSRGRGLSLAVALLGTIAFSEDRSGRLAVSLVGLFVAALLARSAWHAARDAQVTSPSDRSARGFTGRLTLALAALAVCVWSLLPGLAPGTPRGWLHPGAVGGVAAATVLIAWSVVARAAPPGEP